MFKSLRYGLWRTDARVTLRALARFSSNGLITRLQLVRMLAPSDDSSHSFTKLIAKGDQARDRRQWGEAATAYEAALQISAGVHPIWVQYAHALKECGNLDAAERAYEKAIALAPEDPDPLLHCAHLLKRRGNVRAIEMFERLYALTHDPDVELELAKLRQRKGVAQGKEKKLSDRDAIHMVKPNEMGVRTHPKPGLYPEQRSVRYIATSSLTNTVGHKLRLYVDGKERWTGVVPVNAKLNGQQESCVDLRLSFPEPEKPTFERLVRVESATIGLRPSSAEVSVEYANRFSGSVVSLMPNRKGHKAIVRFSDRAALTTAPIVRVESLAGAPLATRMLGHKIRRIPNNQVEFECVVLVEHATGIDYNELSFFPMWSTIPLSKPIAELAETADRLADETDFISGTNLVSAKLDFVRDGFVGGWAKLSETGEARLVVDVICDGKICVSTAANRLRNDLKKAFNTSGQHAFEIELPVGLPEDATIEVRPRAPGGLLGKGSLKVPPLANGRRIYTPEPEQLLVSCRVGGLSSTHTFANAPTVTAIILNRNGAGLLKDLFESVARLNSYAALDFVVVDHGSSDASAEVCASFADALAIKFVNRGFNDSFSASNNFGARLTQSDLLLFLNNDTVFIEDMIARLASHFGEASIGAVGLRLVDTWSPYVDSLAPDRVDQHLGVFFRPGTARVQMYEMRPTPYTVSIARDLVQTPAVTAAALMMRRSDFERMAGFDERFFYGQEDVDLCLRVSASGMKVVCDNRISLAHRRGFSRSRQNAEFARTQGRNRQLIESKHARSVRKLFRSNLLDRAHLTGIPLQIAFVVTENHDETLAGDFFTARELAEALNRELPLADIRFIRPNAQHKIDLAGIDIAIIMRDDFSIMAFSNIGLACHLVYWVRNWFDRFLESDNWHYADEVWCSSKAECERFEAVTGRRAKLLPIATNWERFTAAESDPDYACDYCFTGSNWGVHREISVNILPETVDARFRIFGDGWARDKSLGAYSFGALPYSEMPRVYASTRVVIDDANHVTINSGSVNSRVFDAIGAGALPLSNGVIGSYEIFEGALPVYSSSQELKLLLEAYLGNEELRKSKVAELQHIVQNRHTYQHRARDVVRYLREEQTRLPSIAIKIPVPDRGARDNWGDYHFAEALRRRLERQGHRAGLFYLGEWDSDLAASAEASLVIRGLNRARTSPHQINLMWVISHPDLVSVDEYRNFDHVFIASDHLKTKLCNQGVKATAALQCSDVDRFRLDLEPVADAPRVLFVGNSRGVRRKIVADAIEAGLDLHIYGTGWEGLVPENFVKGSYIPNEELPRWYASAGVVLNDHWETMAEAGILSNRLFDIVACGARCVSDNVLGMDAVFDGAVRTYDTPSELKRVVMELLLESGTATEQRRNYAHLIAQEHSFEQRAVTISEQLRELMAG